MKPADQALTALTVEKLGPREKRFEVPDARARGLRLVVMPSGHKSWHCRYQHHGRGRRLVLGPYPALGLDDARKAAAAAVREALSGRDPQAAKIEARKAAAAGVAAESIFANAWERFLTDTRERLKRRPATLREYERLGRRIILPRFGKLKLADVSRADVLRLVDREAARGAGVQANRLRAVLRRFFNFTIGKDWLATNPAENVPKPYEEEARERTLKEHEIRLLWAACDKLGYPFGPFTKLLLLTAARRDEVAGMLWSELDIEKRIWTLPGERTKNGRAHRVFLADQTLAVLRTVPRVAGKEGFVFTGTGKTAASGFGKAKARLDSLMRELAGADVEPFTFHDLRRTAATGMAELGVPIHVTEACLNHKAGKLGGLTGVYQRYDFAKETKAAFEAWAAHVTKIVISS